MPVQVNRLEEAAVELNRRAAVATPLDARRVDKAAADRETNKLARYVLNSIVDNSELAMLEDRPMCGDTGVPRYYVKAGNDVQIEGGFAALEHALRRGLARATQDVKLRSNRVHPLTRRNPRNNVGVFAPNIDYRFEPEGDWIDIPRCTRAACSAAIIGCCFRVMASLASSALSSIPSPPSTGAAWPVRRRSSAWG